MVGSADTGGSENTVDTVDSHPGYTVLDHIGDYMAVHIDHTAAVASVNTVDIADPDYTGCIVPVEGTADFVDSADMVETGTAVVDTMVVECMEMVADMTGLDTVNMAGTAIAELAQAETVE